MLSVTLSPAGAWDAAPGRAVAELPQDAITPITITNTRIIDTRDFIKILLLVYSPYWGLLDFQAVKYLLLVKYKFKEL